MTRRPHRRPPGRGGRAGARRRPASALALLDGGVARVAPASVARQQTEEAFLDAAERLLVERRPRRHHDARRSPRRRAPTTASSTTTSARWRTCSRACSSGSPSGMIARQRAMYSAPGRPVRREVAHRDALPRRRPRVPEGLVRAAGAGLEPARAARARRARRRRVARRAQRGARRAARALRHRHAARRAGLARDHVQRGHHLRAALRHRDRARPSCSSGSTAGSEKEEP